MSTPIPLVPLTSCPIYAPLLGALGLAASMAFTGNTLIFCQFTIIIAMGAAYGTAKSGVGILTMGVMHPELVIRSSLPVIMAGIVALYGLIINFIMLNSCTMHSIN